MQQRVVVNGAENPLGRRVSAELSSCGWAVTTGVKTGDSTALRAALSDAQALVNCAVGGTNAIAQAAPGLQIVHLGSMTVYGSAEGWIDESSPTRADLGDYAAAHIAAETALAAHPGAVILRLGVEYGPGCPAWTERVARWLLAGRLGDLGSQGDGICNLVFIDDLVAIVMQVLRTPGLGGQTFNVAQSSKPTWNEYFTQFAIALGAVPVRRISSRRLLLESKLLAVPLKVAELGANRSGIGRSRIPPAITPSLLQTCRQEDWLSGLKAEQTFSVSWTPLGAGLQSCADAIRHA
jgi:nucleoside-diphosphate-sugar epimerase